VSNVLQFRRRGPVPPTLSGKPELVYDPETDRWGIVIDSVEVINGLDPVGIRKRLQDEAVAHFAAHPEEFPR
jgi:hypothetical protein